MDRFCSPAGCSDCPIKVVCRCLQVTEQEIVRAITALELQTVKEVRRATGAGDGCNCCHGKLQQYLQQHNCAEVAA